MAETSNEAVGAGGGHSHSAHEILKDPEFVSLAKKKNAVSLVLTLVTFVIYFGFMGALATNSSLVTRPAIGPATSGIPFGIGVIIMSCVLTGIYVVWANSTYDTMVANVKNKIK